MPRSGTSIFFHLVWVPLTLLMTMFSGYGALASLEPQTDGKIAMGWLVFYVLTGLVCLGLTGWLVWSAFWKEDPWEDGMGEVHEMDDIERPGD